MNAPTKSIIEATDVEKAYGRDDGGVRALKGVSLRVPEGELLSLVGSSGSGKSTLLNLFGGIDRPSSGSILIDGSDLSRASDRELTLMRRRTVGIVFQFFNLMPTLTVLENVLLPAEISGEKAEAARERAETLLGRVGIGHRIGHRPHELSGGEMQRVAIARALINRPKILLADEPTGNLDTRNGEAVLELIADTARGEGLTLVMATHDHAIAERCDRIVELKDGMIVADA